MAPKIKMKKNKFPRVSLIEQSEIDYRIRLESCKFMRYIVYLSLLVNGLVGGFYLSAFSDTNLREVAIYWYTTLILLNVINVLWARCCINGAISHEAIKNCWRGFCIIIVLICITWGSIGVLFISSDLQKQMVTISFLSAAVIAFTFPTAIDLKLGMLCIVSLLTPIIMEYFYLASISYHRGSNLDFAIASTLLILGIFMMVSCYLANKIIIKVLKLGYENDLLRQKLETMNASLEKRVKERTKALEKSLKLVTYQATHDLLTELPNERLLYNKVSKLIEHSIINSSKFAICSLSVNNFETISNSIGYQAVSRIMQRIAERFSDTLQKSQNYFISLSRQDIFVIVINSVHTEIEVKRKVEQIFDVLVAPIYIDNQALRITASAGVSIFPEQGTHADLLLTNAEAARVNAMRLGGNNIRIYNKVINAGASRILSIENLLYSVVENNELLLHYQPFFNVKKGTICGAEALVRWDSPVLGMLSPLEFIPVAEANGMIIPIGEWVIRTACTQLKEWHKKGYKELKISINLSAKQLGQSSLISFISKILDELNLDPKYLDLELTESNAFHQEVLPLINQFVDLGISLSIDDFGTGYSEFSNLKLFKVNLIKIDKSFIEDITVNADSKNIVRNTIALGKSMNIDCIAEGVENKEQLDFLVKAGCNLMQGYYFSKPLSSDSFFELLKNYPKYSKIQ